MAIDVLDSLLSKNGHIGMNGTALGISDFAQQAFYGPQSNLHVGYEGVDPMNCQLIVDP